VPTVDPAKTPSSALKKAVLSCASIQKIFLLHVVCKGVVKVALGNGVERGKGTVMSDRWVSVKRVSKVPNVGDACPFLV
jgi:hypothetical protein